ncbi:PTS IIA-like nitrogen-regulatory protein PtsN [Labilithrix luteola]|uniref:PTS IIA-like nitrogen-regulatory protein PtsN n=1 Tax=Labilithrix luteola TaxID=1391654 RepID=A0A0K1QA92_9BACT|nr:PTS sugar transporter subunit IIA [Labilithrix luteola]AKV02592.1 PTS IIA-like nitrogen-regulatory protein PtsN [Labilithrix luteola]
MRLTDLLSPERVGIKRTSANDDFDKETAIGLLATMLGEHDGVTTTEIERVLLEREALQSTGIGEGVAIPHGALPQLTEQVAALLIVPAGVEFQAIDDAPVSILFGVIGPKRATGEHLKTLARVSRLLRSKDFRTRLINAESSSKAFELISAEEAEKKGGV